ncbi:MAG: hypothetical protein U0903_05830 [Planctomycetales bacterium]
MSTAETSQPVAPPAPAHTPRRRWRWVRTLLLACLIFVCGTVTGGALTMRFITKTLQGFLQHPEEAPDRILPIIKRKLRLTDEQYAKVSEIVRTRHQNLQAIRNATVPKVHAEFQKVDEEVSAVLNPDQRKQWHTRFRELESFWFPSESEPGK